MCLSDFLAFDSLPLKQTDMGMDSGGADRPEALTAPAVIREWLVVALVSLEAGTTRS